LALQFGAALRAQELLDLKLRNIKRSANNYLFLCLESTKGGKRATQPILTWAEGRIDEYLETRKKEGEQPSDWFIVRYPGDSSVWEGHVRKEWLIRRFRREKRYLLIQLLNL